MYIIFITGGLIKAVCLYGSTVVLLELAEALTDYTIFYNGPKCGASAPDHAHFQAGNKGFMMRIVGVTISTGILKTCDAVIV